jgi:hypothetical protein
VKVDAHVAKAIAAKPKLVQISTGYTKPHEGDEKSVAKKQEVV